MGSEAKHAFISYVAEDKARVDKLCRVLEVAGVPYWRDRQSLGPGDMWKAKIREAIRSDSMVFLACFSAQSRAKEKSFMNDELWLAVEEFRLRPPGRKYLFPIRFDAGEVPEWELGGGMTLNDLQYTDLFGKHYTANAFQLVDAIKAVMGVSSPEPATAQSYPAPGIPYPTSVQSAVVYPTPDQINIDVIVVEQQCFGSAGCNVTYRIEPTYIGREPLTNESFTVVYTVNGGDDRQMGNFTVSNGVWPSPEGRINTPPNPTLTAVTTRVMPDASQPVPPNTATDGPDSAPGIPYSTSVEPVVYPTPDQINIDVIVVEQQCFGSSGCNVKYRIKPTYIGREPLTNESFTVVYTVNGGDDRQIGNFTVSNGVWPSPEGRITTPPNPTLTAVTTRVMPDQTTG